MTAAGWERLGRRIRAERGRLGYTVEVFAAETGLSPRTIRAIETGKHTGRPRESTLARIELALGWQAGSAERVVEGGRPRDVPDPLLARVIAGWPRLSGDDQARIAGLVERLARGE